MYSLFSTDDHVVEHAAVWSDRVPKKFLDRAPHVIEREGRQYWAYEDTLNPNMGYAAVAGQPRDEWKVEPARFSDMILGCYDPKQRAKDMLDNNILASVCFPSLPRFGGRLFVDFDDKRLADACVRAYNEFILDEWCPSGPPGMYVPMTIGQAWDAELCAAEVRRCADLGARAFSFLENPESAGLPSFYTDYWDPVWQACVETSLPVCLHTGSSGITYRIPSDAPTTVPAALGFVGSFVNCISIAIGPVCRRFPELRIVFSEGGIGWVPAALERADRQFLRHYAWDLKHLDWFKLDSSLPSEIFQRNIWVSMISEPIGINYRYDIGIEKIFWEADYPHADTPWPETQSEIEETFKQLPAEEVEAITHRNAEAFFDWGMAESSLAPVAP